MKQELMYRAIHDLCVLPYHHGRRVGPSSIRDELSQLGEVGQPGLRRWDHLGEGGKRNREMDNPEDKHEGRPFEDASGL